VAHVIEAKRIRQPSSSKVPLELPRQVARFQRRPYRRGKDEAGYLPARSRPLALELLPVLVREQGGDQRRS
jgi:hypothetical protein